MKKILIAILGIFIAVSIAFVAALSAEQQVKVTIIPGKFNVFSPIENELYNHRMIPLNLSMTGKVKKFRYGYIDNGGDLVTLCRDCDEYGFNKSKIKPFDDGFHELTLLGIFETGSISQVINFRVDTKKPNIKKTAPEKGLANGNFEVLFQEANPVSLVLNYGNSIKQSTVNLSNCISEKENIKCKVFVNLTEFDRQKIEYWFELTDILNQTDISKKREIIVDATAPKINDINLTLEKKMATFIFNITEENFDELRYFDNTNNQSKALCGEIKNNICEKTVSFNDGGHNLSLSVLDKAGNEAVLEDNLIFYIV